MPEEEPTYYSEDYIESEQSVALVFYDVHIQIVGICSIGVYAIEDALLNDSLQVLA